MLMEIAKNKLTYLLTYLLTYQKLNSVKLKSAQILLRIACLADRKSYMVIICDNSCEKLTKSENVSS